MSYSRDFTSKRALRRLKNGPVKKKKMGGVKKDLKKKKRSITCSRASGHETKFYFLYRYKYETADIKQKELDDELTRIQEYSSLTARELEEHYRRIDANNERYPYIISSGPGLNGYQDYSVWIEKPGYDSDGYWDNGIVGYEYWDPNSEKYIREW